MPSKEMWEKYYKKRNPTPKQQHMWNAVSWIRAHPEDIPMAKENLEARDRGFDDDAVKNLFAAISLKACCDYKAASKGVYIDGRNPEVTMEDCHEFFGSDIFQHFINRISVEDIEQLIKDTPDGALSSLARSLE